MAGGIFCDLEKAFDSVGYDILLFKLEYYGIKGIDKALYKSYLYNRYQTVSLYEKDTHKFSFSNWAEVKSGIPQAPPPPGYLLFLICINDLLKATNNRSIPILFVDDTTALFSHSNPDDFVENIHTVFETLSTWFKRILSSLNMGEGWTLYTHCNEKYFFQFLQISEDNRTIPNVSYTKFLGLIIDNTLSWKTHNDKLID
jgi:hypothetical protein